jgi:hypothetical protein
MPQHPALEPGNVAVVTGGADGIGPAAAEKFASLGFADAAVWDGLAAFLTYTEGASLILLYPTCLWYRGIKRAHPTSVLKYF